MAVDAPFSSRVFTTSTSADFIAKKRTGIGTPEALGSAPLFNNKSKVLFILSLLKVEINNSHLSEILKSEWISIFEMVYWNDTLTLFLNDLDWNECLSLTHYLTNIIQVCCTCIFSVTKKINYVNMHWGFDCRAYYEILYYKMGDWSFWYLIYGAKDSYSFFMIARCLTLPRSALLFDRLPPTIFSLVLSWVAHLSIILSETSMW